MRPYSSRKAQLNAVGYVFNKLKAGSKTLPGVAVPLQAAVKKPCHCRTATLLPDTAVLTSVQHITVTLRYPVMQVAK
jgi:hypothetical protein